MTTHAPSEAGHAGGHLREPVLELLAALYGNETRWWDVDRGDGEPFTSAQAAYAHLGRLWNCTDIVPSEYRLIAEGLIPEGVTDHLWTYARLVRALRPVLADEVSL